MKSNNQHPESAAECRFNFTGNPQPDDVTVPFNQDSGAPHYDENKGYGFVEWTCALKHPVDMENHVLT
ncbi:hypothetical protein C2I18_21115 [Paenibacillus sp. PK3_47]|uniref:hypothetical protein n=1 Tax=Paenibacillus sp. PK3_47 TaxID=2072642 RepID=UPI00201E1B75|nr:hypothetical protein [Paenibacillus sp. PK3_47]UQZ35808.1 hypothetical protein C2I18_21115 [Paenibacillus sp. PK3_47]